MKKKIEKLDSEDAIKFVGKTFFDTIGIIQIIAVMAVIVSVFIFIFGFFILAIQVFMSGAFVVILMYLSHKFVYNIIAETVDNEIAKQEDENIMRKIGS